MIKKEILPAKLCDSRLIWRNGSWYLGACYKDETPQEARTKQPEAVALDPGIRSFISFYSPHCSGNIGRDTSENIFKYFIALDTSKTHPQTGVVNRKLGSAKTVKLTNGSRACRDIVGAFNFLLKTLVVDTPTFN